MFIKSLTIKNDNGIVREINFHRGLNLIVDNTPDVTTFTGNNVGKTTVLKLIDFCLGKDGKVIYSDESNPKVEHKEVKNFLIDTNVVVELILTSNFNSNDVIIRRNFLKHSKVLREINGVCYNEDDFISELERVILGYEIPKPTFRQIISHNIRYSDLSVSNMLKTLNAYTSDAEYETLFLYMFGCTFDESSTRIELLEKLKSDSSYKAKLEKSNSKNTYLSLLGLTNSHIEELEGKKSKLNINPDFSADMDSLNSVKYKINSITSRINTLQIRKNVILDTQNELKKQKSDIDVSQLELIYKQANALIPNLHHTFNDLVNYHNRMLDNKLSFIVKSLPEIEDNLRFLNKELNYLLEEEDKLTKKIVKSDTYEDLENLIDELNKEFQKKGEYENLISQISDVEDEISRSEKALRNIDDSLFSDAFMDRIQSQINKFNNIFSRISKQIYNEEYAIQWDNVTNKKTGVSYYKFSSFNANLSTGKKMGEISCFDIAYTIFARMENIPCLEFLLTDKKELMSDNQLIDIAKIVEEENIQFVASILKDKLPVTLNDKNYFIVELSQSDKLFKI